MSYPLPSLAPTISAAGITAPTYYDIWQSLLATYRSIFGADVYLEPDSKDGQWIAALAQALHNSNQAAIAVFNSFSPSYAYGETLSSRVKLNGLSRRSATRSTAVGVVGGIAGTQILNGKVRDVSGNFWLLPSPTVIGVGGTTTVTVTAENEGEVLAIAGDINEIYNPQYGWQTFTSTEAAVPGAAIETDAELRLRQLKSTALPAQTVLESIYSALGNLPGVTRQQVYNNGTDATDINGLPPHSICAVVEGGDSYQIARAISLKMTAGSNTHGDIVVPVFDARGLSSDIRYFALDGKRLYVTVTIRALAGYNSGTAELIQNSLVDYVKSLDIGEDVYYTKAVAAATLQGTTEGRTFYVSDLKLGLTPTPTSSSNLVVAFNAAATLGAADVAVVVE